MKKQLQSKRFCGNCNNHSVYHYPDLIFCRLRHLSRSDPIVQTLGFCEQWEPCPQECFCVEEALNKRGQKFAESREE